MYQNEFVNGDTQSKISRVGTDMRPNHIIENGALAQFPQSGLYSIHFFNGSIPEHTERAVKGYPVGTLLLKR